VFISNTVIPTPLDKAVIADHVLLLALQFPMLGRQRGRMWLWREDWAGFLRLSLASFTIMFALVYAGVCGRLLHILKVKPSQVLSEARTVFVPMGTAAVGAISCCERV